MDNRNCHISKLRKKEQEIEVLITFNNPHLNYWMNIEAMDNPGRTLEYVLKNKIRITGTNYEYLERILSNYN